MKVLVNPAVDIPEQNRLTLVVLNPKYSLNTGDVENTNAARVIKEIATKKGNSDRIYRNTIFFLAPSEAGLAIVKSKLQECLGCRKIMDEYRGQLDKDQMADVVKRNSDFDREATKAIINAYNVVVRYSAKNGFSRYDLTTFANDFTVQIRNNLMEELIKESWILKSIGGSLLSKNNLMPTVENPIRLHDIYEAFLKFDDKPMILNADTIKACANDNCLKGHFNIAQSNDGKTFKNIKHLATMNFLDPMDDSFWIIDESIVEKPVETPTAPNQPGDNGTTTNAGNPPPVSDQPLGGVICDPPMPQGSDKTIKSLLISGTITATQWTQVYSSFINLLRNNNLEIDFRIKAHNTDRNPLTESSQTFKIIKESANQMGLTLDAEE